MGKNFNQLPSATLPLGGTEVVPIWQGGVTTKVAVSDLTAGRAVTATSVNKLTITAPATASTLTIADGKTLAVNDNATLGTGGLTLGNSGGFTAAASKVLTASNSLTLAGTDATTHTFPTTSATIARTDAAQTFTGDQTLGTGNLVQGTAAKGFNFTANTPAAGMTSQLFKEYEEGTWTPVIRGDATAGTYELDAITACTYTKVGRIVVLTALIKLAGAITAGGTGDLQIAGLPILSTLAAFPQGAVVLSGVNFTAGAGLSISFSGFDAGQNILYIRITNPNAAITYIPISGVSATDQIGFTFIYTG